MNRLRRVLATAGYAVAFAVLFVGLCIADLPRPSDWLASRRFRAREAARRRKVEEGSAT